MIADTSMPSLRGTLDHLAPHAPAALIDAGALRRAGAIAGTLPAALSTWTYLECRLGADSGQVDLIVDAEAPARDILLRENPHLALPAAFAGHTAWQRVAAVCEAWRDPHGALDGHVERIWLEFDIESSAAETASAIPVPGIFVDFYDAPFLRGPVDDRLAMLDAAIVAMAGVAPAPGVRRHLRRCLEELPEGGTLRYVGMLLARGGDAVRICLRGIDDADLPAYLARAGWPGDPDELAHLQAELRATHDAEFARSVSITHLDVGANGVAPRIGLEVPFHPEPQLRGRLVEGRFLEWLVARGLCTEAQRAGLAAWPGAELRRLPHQLWPSPLVRRVQHVKLMFTPRRSLAAKAYLCAFPMARPAAGAARAAATQELVPC